MNVIRFVLYCMLYTLALDVNYNKLDVRYYKSLQLCICDIAPNTDSKGSRKYKCIAHSKTIEESHPSCPYAVTTLVEYLASIFHTKKLLRTFFLFNLFHIKILCICIYMLSGWNHNS